MTGVFSFSNTDIVEKNGRHQNRITNFFINTVRDIQGPVQVPSDVIPVVLRQVGVKILLLRVIERSLRSWGFVECRVKLSHFHSTGSYASG
jgi:hypothetical protein